MADNLVSQPPLQVPLADANGNISKAWSIWFRDLYRRVAYKKSNAIDDNKKETDESINGINTNLENIDDGLLGIGSTIELIIEAVNDNETTMNNHIGAESAHGSNGNIIGSNDTATVSVAGLVKMMALVVDAVNATSSVVSIDSPDATTAPGAYDQTQIESIVTLANETKVDVNQLVTDMNTVVSEVNAIVTQLNSVITNSKTAGQMNNV